MQGRTALLALLGAAMLLSACASGDAPPRLMNLRAPSNGPDEFAILPPKALEMPASLSDLPAPTPGGANLTDPDPKADAIAALGGKPGKPGAGIPAVDAGLVRYAGRYGGSTDIRQQLAAEDLAWREKNSGRLLERLFAVNVYFKAYAPFALDQFAELAYWRQRGVQTPSAPPPKPGER